MNDYALRFIESDRAELLQLGELLGAIQITDDTVTATQGGCWDYIGAIHKPTGEFTDHDGMSIPVTTPIVDPDGNEYLHVNLRTPLDLAEVAANLVAEHPEIEAGLNNLGKFFLLEKMARLAYLTNLIGCSHELLNRY